MLWNAKTFQQIKIQKGWSTHVFYATAYQMNEWMTKTSKEGILLDDFICLFFSREKKATEKERNE